MLIVNLLPSLPVLTHANVLLLCNNGNDINLFLLLYPLKTSENPLFSDFFRGYRKRPVASNGLSIFFLRIHF